MRFIYTVLYSLGFVLLIPVFLYKMWKRGKYRENFFQRFGFYDAELHGSLAEKAEKRCWIQAVSVGEVNVALMFIQALQERFPQLRIILTTTTSTGYTLAYERLPQEVELLYFPQDFPWCVRRAYDLIQPDFVVLMESELWPNHIWMGARRNVPIFLVNGRMSPRSARRYRAIRWLSGRALSQLSLVCAQTREDADNFRAAGAIANRIHVTGNMKYDASMPYADVQKVDPIQLLKQIGISPSQPILVAGSTHPGEEEIIFDVVAALRQRFPNLFLVVVPRHVERTREVVELAKRKRVKFILRSDVNPHLVPTAKPYDCLLVNTTGELKWLYKVATIIFVGKSLMGQGGQNIVEAAVSGHPVVFGPHMQNFKAIAAQFVAEGACVQVQDGEGLRRALQELLQDSDKRQKIAAAARRVIEANVGATARSVKLIAKELGHATG
ncbi:MAG TPA: 3-deoxy-D-manno-octulosonic acid transferase [Verrucomicrobiae bacterium]|nr:3-deoxy-D-manno-octulosonic acid transferase [Verrucomicrobiae bacterium]